MGIPVGPANTVNSKAFALYLTILEVDYAILSVFKVLQPRERLAFLIGVLVVQKNEAFYVGH